MQTFGELQVKGSARVCCRKTRHFTVIMAERAFELGSNHAIRCYTVLETRFSSAVVTYSPFVEVTS